MSEGRVTLADIFNVSKIDKSLLDGLAQAKDVAGSVGDLASTDAAGSVLPPLVKDQLLDMMTQKLGDLLGEIDVVTNILGTAWGQAQELIDWVSGDISPHKVYSIPLVTHEIASEHNPAVEPQFKQKSLGEFLFKIALKLSLEGVILEIQDFHIRKVHIGSCTGTGNIGHSNLNLLDFPEQVIEGLRGPIDLGEGIPLKVPGLAGTSSNS